MDKRYVAVVDGRPQPARGKVELPLLVDWPNRPLHKVDFEHGKPSLTRYRVLRHDPVSDSSRVALVPETGRTHQLRVHMQAIGHVILGDALYADPVAPRQGTAPAPARRVPRLSPSGDRRDRRIRMPA